LVYSVRFWETSKKNWETIGLGYTWNPIDCDLKAIEWYFMGIVAVGLLVDLK